MPRKLTIQDYHVTPGGRVFSPYREMKLSLSSNGYYTFGAGSDGNVLLHRELAKRYLPNPENKRTVNHKDGNKLNNSLDNLEWATDSENNQHKYDVLGMKPTRGRMKISDRAASDIMRMKGKIRQVDLAYIFAVPRGTIASIHAGTRKIQRWEEDNG